LSLVVIEPGMLTLVQDRGRYGHGALGVSAAGAADALALRIGNRLVGNGDGAAALEMTLRGGSFLADEDAVVALCGADFESTIPRYAAMPLRAGTTVAIGATRGGARCTLCIRGGVAVPAVMGSRATHLASGLGGFEGRALRKGDRIPVGPAPERPPARLRVPPSSLEAHAARRTLRVTEGPQRAWFPDSDVAAFLGAPWTVTEEADRMGLRLRGPAIGAPRGGSLVSEGVCNGAIQITGSGGPIILFVDQQTTGGYPKPFNVVTADLAALAQLRPRDQVRFEAVTLAAARAALRDQEAELAAAFEEPS
jgi:antagonist of KipI